MQFVDDDDASQSAKPPLRPLGTSLASQAGVVEYCEALAKTKKFSVVSRLWRCDRGDPSARDFYSLIESSCSFFSEGRIVPGGLNAAKMLKG